MRLYKSPDMHILFLQKPYLEYGYWVTKRKKKSVPHTHNLNTYHVKVLAYRVLSTQSTTTLLYAKW